MQEVTTHILKTRQALCRRCFQCVRKCPVKAIRNTETHLEIDENRCIYCGACVLGCSQEAIIFGDDIERATELLTGRQVVAVLAPEAEAAFPDASRAQLDAALKILGFYAVEDSTLGEEIVAAAYADLLSKDTNKPVIRSTCPAIVNFIETRHPELIEFLAPIAGPMFVQARLIKELYAEKPAVVFIGPCIAKKSEIRQKAVAGEIELVLTFDELARMFAARQINPAELTPDEENVVTINRAISAPGGFPMPVLSRHLSDGYLEVSRGVSAADQTLAKLTDEPANPRFFDLLSCRGCIDGPAFNLGSRLSRLAEIKRRSSQSRANLSFDTLGGLPQVDLGRRFTANLAHKDPVKPEEIQTALALAGLSDPAQQLDCAVCGYDTCQAHAEATVTGFSDWSACFPYQRRIFRETTALLKEASNTDGLTGLVNHRGFVEAIANEFNRYQRYRVQMSLVMVDVDNFKEINDTYGHLQGDRVLKLIGQILKQNVRDCDVLARYGGDEFAIILPETSKNEAAAVAEKLRLRVAATVFWLGQEIERKISLSLGVCNVNETDVDPMVVLSRADKALYQAKEAGRNKTVVAD